MRAGELRERIQFEEKVISYVGEVEYETWTNPFSRPGVAERISEQNARFTLRYRADIRPDTHRILFFGAIWSITNVLPDPRKTQIIIDCDFSAKVEVPHLQSTTREYIDGKPIVAPPAPAEND